MSRTDYDSYKILFENIKNLINDGASLTLLNQISI